MRSTKKFSITLPALLAGLLTLGSVAPAANADDQASRRRAAQRTSAPAAAPAASRPSAPAPAAASPSRRAAQPAARPSSPAPSRAAAPAPARPQVSAAPTTPSRRAAARPAPSAPTPAPSAPAASSPAPSRPAMATPSRRVASPSFESRRPTPQVVQRELPARPSVVDVTSPTSRRRAASASFDRPTVPSQLDPTKRASRDAIINQAAPPSRARFHRPALDVPERDVHVDVSNASIDNARLSRLHAYSYGGYKHRKGHASHFGFGYKDHYGFGYGKHFRPGFRISFHYGSHHYPYYHHRYIRRGYSCYDYGFGYSFRYGGYYSSFYDYCPPVTYRDYDSFYNVTYRTYNYYYPSATYTSSAPASYYQVVEDVYADQPYGAGWKDLADGDARSAFRYFSQAASRNLDDGAPKIGYAIASSMLGDHRRAAWAMRRAFEVDPFSVQSLIFDDRLLARLDTLAEELAQRSDRSGGSDDDFMLAAISLLIQDYRLANVAISAAIEQGDRSQAAQNLQSMIPVEDFNYDE